VPFFDNQEGEMPEDRKGKGKSAAGGAKTTKARGGLAKPVKPDATLAKVVGGDPVTRAALTKKVWDYVKKNDLQDPKDRRTIRADDKLRPVFGGKDKVSMFEMTKLVNQHVSPT
jgi:upstream activation factor subunit UAF30